MLSSIGQIERAGVGRAATDGAARPSTSEFSLLKREQDFEVKASSNDAMIAAVFDDSTETFWEAGAQDHEGSFKVTIDAGMDKPSAIRLHVDNSRDADRKCNSITLKVTAPGAKSHTSTVKVPGSFGGWVMMQLPCDGGRTQTKTLYTFLFEGGGMDHQFGAGNRLSPRLRGMKIFGAAQDVDNDAAQELQMMGEEAIQVFRAVARNVMFGSGGEVPEEEVEAEEEDADGEAVAEGHALARAGSANLREHVVSLLFSGDSEKLPPLQKQVCSLIFSELQQEAAGMAAAPGALDDFTFELCSLVLALSGTRAGVRHIASLPSILTTICTLLTVGTPRLQRQAIVILKRTVLQNMSPDAADKMLRARMQYVRAEGFCGFLMALAASGFSGSVQLRVPGAPMTATSPLTDTEWPKRPSLAPSLAWNLSLSSHWPLA